MYDYLLPVDGVRLAFVLGIIASLLLYERRHVSTGGIVVPGYFGAFLLNPLVIAVTLVNAVVVHVLVERVVSRRVLIYGHRKLAALAITSVALQLWQVFLLPRSGLSIHAIGFIIPGLLAHDISRQGIRRTIGASVGAGIAVGALVLATVLLVPASFVASNATPRLAVGASWLPVAVLLAVVASAAVWDNHGLRAGGFLGGAYLGLLAVDLRIAAMMIAVALVTWWVVSRVLTDVLSLFGRRKFASMLLVSSIVSWAALSVVGSSSALGTFSASAVAGLALVPMFVPGLLANDFERVGVGRTSAGTALVAGFMIASTRLAMSVAAEAPDLRLVPVVAMLGAVVFWNQLGWAQARVVTGLETILEPIGAGIRSLPARLRVPPIGSPVTSSLQPALVAVAPIVAQTVGPPPEPDAQPARSPLHLVRSDRWDPGADREAALSPGLRESLEQVRRSMARLDSLITSASVSGSLEPTGPRQAETVDLLPERAELVPAV